MTDNSQQVIALIKFFSEEQHYLSFKDGCSMFRTPHFYRKRDDIGRGDRSESCLGYWDKGLGDTIPSFINNDSSVDLTNAQSLLVYPAHEQRDAWLQSWCAIGPHNKFEQSLEKMLNEFGSYFVVLQASNIDEYVKLVSKASGADVSYGLVQYSDNLLDRSLTVKDSKLCYQKEFRFYVGECSKDEVNDKKLQLNGLNNILSNAASLKLTSPSGEIRYCSLGSKKVVTTNE